MKPQQPFLSNKKLIRPSSFFLYLILLCILDGLVYYLKGLLITPEILLEEFTQYLDYETALTIVNKSQTTGRIITKYLLHLSLLSIKITITSLILYFGLFLAKQQFLLKQVLTSVTILYPLFFVLDLAVFFYFQFVHQNFTYFELSAFNPFSFTTLINLAGFSLQGNIAAFFNAFSILDILFCLLLSHELNKQTETPLNRVVFVTYFGGLILYKSLVLLLKP